MKSEKVQELNELSFASVVESPRTVLVDFTAEWCPPCRALSPVVARIAEENWGHIDVVRVDADACPALAAKFRIRGLPTLVVFRDGKEIARRVGLTNEDGVRSLLGPALTKPSSAVA